MKKNIGLWGRICGRDFIESIVDKFVNYIDIWGNDFCIHFKFCILNFKLLKLWLHK